MGNQQVGHAAREGDGPDIALPGTPKTDWVPIQQLAAHCSPEANGFLLQDNEQIRPPCYVPAMNYGAVKIILERAISSPAEVELPELDEAIRWVEDRGTIRRLEKGTGGDVYNSQFDAAAVELRVLRRQLTGGQYAGATASAQRVLTLLAP